MDNTNKLSEAVAAFVGALTEDYSAGDINAAFEALGYRRTTPPVALPAVGDAEAVRLAAEAHGYVNAKATGWDRENLHDIIDRLAALATHAAPASASELEPPRALPGGWLSPDSRPADGMYLVKNDVGQVAPWINGVIHNAVGTANDWNYGESITGWMPMPIATPASLSGMSATEQALQDERAKFQQETRRTSELSQMLSKWIERHHDEHGGGPVFTRKCGVCALVEESKALLAKPINAPSKEWSLNMARLEVEHEASFEAGGMSAEPSDDWFAGYRACMAIALKHNASEQAMLSGMSAEPAAAGEPDMRAICETLGFDPTNHHNAAKCPYCRPSASASVAGASEEPRLPEPHVYEGGKCVQFMGRHEFWDKDDVKLAIRTATELEQALRVARGVHANLQAAANEMADKLAALAKPAGQGDGEAGGLSACSVCGRPAEDGSCGEDCEMGSELAGEISKKRNMESFPTTPVVDALHAALDALNAWQHSSDERPATDLAQSMTNKVREQIGQLFVAVCAPQTPVHADVEREGGTLADRLDSMADAAELGSQAQADLYAAATVWRKHLGGM